MFWFQTENPITVVKITNTNNLRPTFEAGLRWKRTWAEYLSLLSVTTMVQHQQSDLSGFMWQPTGPRNEQGNKQITQTALRVA